MRTKFLTVASIFALFAVGFLISVAYFTFRNTISQIIVTPNPGVAVSSPTPTPDPLAPYGVLLLGLRGDNSKGGFLSDTMILGVVNPRVKHVSLISIPRDLWVPLPINNPKVDHYKINHAYAIGIDDRNYPNKPTEYTGLAGGGILAKHVVQEIFGIPVRYFVSLDFEGFKKSIDILGGVDVNVSKPFEDPYFPITGKETDTCGFSEDDVKALTATLSGEILEHSFMCRYEALKFDRGVVHMDGETALKFARSRHALQDGSDFSRSNRQKEIMLAVKNKVLQIGFVPKAIPFIQSLAGDLRTDMPLDAMKTFASQINDYKTYTVSSIALTTDNVLTETYSADRQYILIPKSGIDDWTSIQEYVKTQLTSQEAQPTTAPNQTQ